MKKGHGIIIIVTLALVFGIACSIVRIAEVNSTVPHSNSEAEFPTNNTSTSSEINIHEFIMGEDIDISGWNSNKQVAPQGVVVCFENAVLQDEEDVRESYPDWFPLFGPSGNRYDDPRYLIADMIITNNGNEISPALWFKLEANSWSTVVSPNETALFNDLDEGETFSINPGETRVIRIAYQLYEPTFSKEQWDNVTNLDYHFVLLNYPHEISVRVSDEAVL